MRILVFGDSITQGMWDSKGGWVQRLSAHYFEQQMQDLDADVPVVFNLGVSADTTDELLQRFEPEAAARRRPDMAIVFAIGTNDSRIDGDTPYATPERFAANLEELARQARRYSQHIFFVGLQPCDEVRTTPVSWKEVTYTNERLQVFDAVLQLVSVKQRAAYVPVFEKFKQHQKTPADLLMDGLHPNDTGHVVIYKQVKRALETLHKESLNKN